MLTDTTHMTMPAPTSIPADDVGARLRTLLDASSQAGLGAVWFRLEEESLVLDFITGVGPARAAELSGRPMRISLSDDLHLVAKVALSGRSCYVEEGCPEMRWPERIDFVRSAYLVPVSVQRELVGVVMFFSGEAAALGSLNRSLLDGLVRSVSDTGALVSQLRGRLAEVNRRLRMLYAGVSAATDTLETSAHRARSADGLEALSSREWEVLTTFVGGKGPDGIAKALNISPHTVRNHFKSIFRKLGVHSQTELLRLMKSQE